MRTELKEEIIVPKDTTVDIKKELAFTNLIVKGKKGELNKTFLTKDLIIDLEDNKIVIKAINASKKEKRMVNTYKAIINNLLKGVNEGFVYKLKICSGHFPMTVTYKNNVIEVKNFIGEAVPRRTTLPKEIEVKINNDIIEVSGIDKETVGNAASKIENLTKRPGFDTRIFQDGIYIIEKNGKKLI